MSSEAKVVRQNFDYLVNEVASDLSRGTNSKEGVRERPCRVTQATLDTASNSMIEVKDRATGLVSAIYNKIKHNKETFDSLPKDSDGRTNPQKSSRHTRAHAAC